MIKSSQINHRGITLVELMVALAVSAILLLGVGTIYGNAKHTYTVDEEFAHLQESARFAMKYLVDDIRMAGYMGCATNTGAANIQCYLNPNPICQTAAGPTSIEGFSAAANTMTASGTQLATSNTINPNWTALTNPATYGAATTFPFAPRPVLATDILIVRHADTTGVNLSAAIGPSSTNFTVTDPSGYLQANDILVISDCTKALIFQATNVAPVVHAAAGNPGNAVANVTWSARDTFTQADTNVMKLMNYAYYIGNSTSADSPPALFRYNGVSSDEVVDGVENMRVLYGVDTDNNGVANEYRPASAVNFAASQVVSVRIALLMRSKNNIPNRPSVASSYQLLDTSVTSIQDQRLRKVFTTTVKLRNKGL